MLSIIIFEWARKNTDGEPDFLSGLRGFKFLDVPFETSSLNYPIGAQTCTNHTVPYGTALFGAALFQALRATL